VKCCFCEKTLTRMNSYERANGNLMGICRQCSKDRVTINKWKKRGPAAIARRLSQLNREINLIKQAIGE